MNHLSDAQFGFEISKATSFLSWTQAAAAKAKVCGLLGAFEAKSLRGPRLKEVLQLRRNVDSLQPKPKSKKEDCLQATQTVHRVIELHRIILTILTLRVAFSELEPRLAHELGASGPLKAQDVKVALLLLCCCQVALLNGANRKLCGNHWFQGSSLKDQRLSI